MEGHQDMACYSNWMHNVSLIGNCILKTGSLNSTILGLLTEKDGGGDSGLKGVFYSFLPHLLAVVVLLVLVSRTLHWSFRFIKQPLNVCQIMTGLILFSFVPKGIGNHGEISLQPANRRVDHVFGMIGVVFNIFIIGVKLDPMTMFKIGNKKPIIIGLGSLFIPFAAGLVLYSFKYKELGFSGGDENKLVAAILAPLSSTLPIGIYEILAELDLLNSDLGRLALSSSMFQSGFGFLCIFVYVVMKQGQKNIIHGLMALFGSVPLLIFTVFVFRPYALRIVRTTPRNARVRDVHIFTITLAVFMLAFYSDICGFFSFTDGPLLLGLVIPHGPPLGTALIERVDLVVSELLVPISFMHQGVYMDWSMVRQNLSVVFWIGFLVLLTFVTKMMANVALALYCKMTVKEGLLMGLIMNFRGLPDMFIYINMINLQLMNNETFSVLVLSNMMITGICAPLVSTYYKPFLVRNKKTVRTVQKARFDSELSIMACFFDDKPVQAMLGFLESTSLMETDKHTCIYSLHIVELQGSLASNLIYHRNKKANISTLQMDPVHNHFIAMEEKDEKKVSVIPVTSVAPINTMHHDICSIILQKNISFVIIPYPKKNSIADLEATNTHDLLLVLEKAQCSVGIMVYHGTTRIMGNSSWGSNVCVIFWGGPDDREAIAIASRMSCHPSVHLSVFRFHKLTSTTDRNCNNYDAYQKVCDDRVIKELTAANEGNDRVNVIEICVGNADQLISTMHVIENNRYELLIVGRTQNCLSMFGEGWENWTESPELGVIGDLVTSDMSNVSDVLIVQQHIAK